MRVRYLRGLLFTVLLLPLSLLAQPRFDASERPSLVLVVVVDQFRYDYLYRAGFEFEAGLRRLLDEGAVLTNANYEAAPTVTAIGHSTIGTGALPAQSGIAGNTWYSRAEDRNVQSITDSTVTPLGGGSSGASPRRLLVSTLADELKASGHGGKAFGVSLKDRSAVLPVGHTADGAFWFDGSSGNMVSSSWYFPALPAWVEDFNAERPADAYADQVNAAQGRTVPGSEQRYRALDATPLADQVILDFALRLLEAEALGQGEGTDFLSVSFSAMDYLGHASGPHTADMDAMIASIDAKVGTLLAAAEASAGSGQVLVVFTADHGVSPVPERNSEQQLPGGRYDGAAEQGAVEAALEAAFGVGDFIAGMGEYSYYFNTDPVSGKTIARSELEAVAAQALRGMPHVYRVYTRSDFERGYVGSDRIDQRMRNGFNAANSGDVIVVHEPYWLGGSGGTTHGSPFSYDTHVPLIFWGPDALVKPGRYHQDAAINDIAATLATMLNVATPSGSVGRVLAEIIP